MKKKDDQSQRSWRHNSPSRRHYSCKISSPFMHGYAEFQRRAHSPSFRPSGSVLSVGTLPAFAFDFKLRNYQITHLPNSRIVVSQMIVWSILRLWKASWTKNLLIRTCVFPMGPMQI